jgi:hypothetical protein
MRRVRRKMDRRPEKAGFLDAIPGQAFQAVWKRKRMMREKNGGRQRNSSPLLQSLLKTKGK